MIEVMITSFIIGTVVVGMFGLFLLALRGAQEGERRVVAIALANERMEMVRNLPYVDVGTAGGVPSGTISQSETITRNTVPYTVTTDIRYIDDPYDGLIGGGKEGKVTICHKPLGNPGGQQTLVVDDSALQAHLDHGDDAGPCPGDDDPSGGDPVNTDYKQVRVDVAWPSPYEPSPILLITYVVPEGIEGGSAEGTLIFQALDSFGVGVAGATLKLFNNDVSPTVSITTKTDNDGRVILPGLPEDADAYEITLSNSGYSSEQTYDTTATFFPDADHAHVTIIKRALTEKTFFIDLYASLTVTSEDDAAQPVKSVPFTLQGSKTIGHDDQGDLVYKTVLAETTSGQGSWSTTELEWDSYTISIDGVASGYDIKETDPLLPLVVNPADTATLAVTLVPHTDYSLRVAVIDGQGVAIDNATVQLTGNGVDETLVTGLVGQVFFADLPVADDYTLDVDAPSFDATQFDVTVDGTSTFTITMTST